MHASNLSSLSSSDNQWTVEVMAGNPLFSSSTKNYSGQLTLSFSNAFECNDLVMFSSSPSSQITPSPSIFSSWSSFQRWFQRLASSGHHPSDPNESPTPWWEKTLIIAMLVLSILFFLYSLDKARQRRAKRFPSSGSSPIEVPSSGVVQGYQEQSSAEGLDCRSHRYLEIYDGHVLLDDHDDDERTSLLGDAGRRPGRESSRLYPFSATRGIISFLPVTDTLHQPYLHSSGPRRESRLIQQADPIPEEQQGLLADYGTL